MRKFLLTNALVLASLAVTGFCEEHEINSGLSHSEATLISTSTKVKSENCVSRGAAAAPVSNNQCGPDWPSFYLGADFLYLFASEGGLDHARIRHIDVPSPVPNLTTATQKKWNQNFKLAPGFRVRLGRYLKYDRWDLFLDYAWYYTHPKTSMSVGTNEFIVTYYPITNTAALSFKSGESDWRLRLHDGDINLGRRGRFGKALKFHVFSGVKVSWIGQNLGAGYRNPQQTASTALKTLASSLQAKSRFLGVGPKLGFSSKWNFSGCLRGCSMDAGMHGALLCGKFHARTEQSAEQYSQSIPRLLVFSSLKNDFFYCLRPVCYYRMGFSWERPVRDRVLFSLRLGWEAQYWWQQMAFFTPRENNVTDKDLYLMGCNLGISLGF